MLSLLGVGETKGRFKRSSKLGCALGRKYIMYYMLHVDSMRNISREAKSNVLFRLFTLS